MQLLQTLSPADGAEQGDVLLLIPRWTPSPQGPVSQAQARQGTPFRSLRIAGTLLAAGYRVHLFDQDLFDQTLLDQRPPEDPDQALETQLPSKVLAIVLWCNELEPLIQTTQAQILLKHFRVFFPEAPSIFGGPLIARLPTEGLWPARGFDYFMQGQGILELPLLLEALRGLRPIEGVPGLVAEGQRSFVGPPPPKRFRVSPEIYKVYQQLDFSGWIQRGGIFGNDQATLVASFTQGCAKGCNFCYWRDFPPAFLETAEAISHLKHLRESYGVRQFHLAELDFASNHRRLLAFADAFGLAIPDGRWFSLVSIVDMARYGSEDWDRLRAGGLAKLEFGTESGSPKTLSRMGKRHNQKQVLKVTREASLRGIHSMHNFVFGIPGETREDLAQSLRLIHALLRMDPKTVSFTFRFFQPPFGTALGEEALALLPQEMRRIDHFLASRDRFGQEDQRTMPWIEASLEKEIKALVYHFLPLASSKLSFGRRRSRALYRFLRRFARMRLGHRFFALPLDRTLYERTLSQPLDNTYTA